MIYNASFLEKVRHLYLFVLSEQKVNVTEGVYI